MQLSALFIRSKVIGYTLRSTFITARYEDSGVAFSLPLSHTLAKEATPRTRHLGAAPIAPPHHHPTTPTSALASAVIVQCDKNVEGLISRAYLPSYLPFSYFLVLPFFSFLFS